MLQQAIQNHAVRNPQNPKLLIGFQVETLYFVFDFFHRAHNKYQNDSPTELAYLNSLKISMDLFHRSNKLITGRTSNCIRRHATTENMIPNLAGKELLLLGVISHFLTNY